MSFQKASNQQLLTTLSRTLAMHAQAAGNERTPTDTLDKGQRRDEAPSPNIGEAPPSVSISDYHRLPEEG